MAQLSLTYITCCSLLQQMMHAVAAIKSSNIIIRHLPGPLKGLDIQRESQLSKI